MSVNSATDSEVTASADLEWESSSSNGAYSSLFVPREEFGSGASCDTLQSGENGSGSKDATSQSEMREVRREIWMGITYKHRLFASAESMKWFSRVSVYLEATGEEIGYPEHDRPDDLGWPPHYSIKELMAYRGFFARRATQEERNRTQKWYTFLESFKPTAVMFDGKLIDHTTAERGLTQLGHVKERITLVMSQPTPE